MRLRSRAAVLAAVAVTSLGAAGAAQADSIAYIKDGNVWLSTPDGSRQHQVTSTGGYSYVSQADDGTMAALAGERIHKLGRDGQVLADITTFASDGPGQSGPVNQFHGPFDPEISPDGSKIAFEWINANYTSGGAGCSPGQPGCYVLTSRKGIGITDSDSPTGHDKYGLLTGWWDTQWLSNDRIMRTDSGANYTADTVFNDIGVGKGDDEMDRWFYDPEGGDLADAELSPDRKVVAAIGGQNDEWFSLYRPLYDPFNAPDQDYGPFGDPEPLVEHCAAFGEPVGGKIEGISIAPDSRHIAYSVGDGVWVANIPDYSSGCSVPTENGLKIPGGHHPDWGPADVPQPRRSDPPPPPRQDEGANARLAPLSIKVACHSKCSVDAKVKAGSKLLAGGRARRGRPGKVRVGLKPTRAGRTALLALRGRRVAVRVVVRERGKKRTSTKKVAVR